MRHLEKKKDTLNGRMWHSGGPGIIESNICHDPFEILLFSVHRTLHLSALTFPRLQNGNGNKDEPGPGQEQGEQGR